jgi:transposase
MTLRPQPLPPIPEATAAAVQAAFPKGNLYVALRTEFGTLYDDQLFADLSPPAGRPVEVAPWRLALVMVMPYIEGLTDRQAADAVRRCMDWKYALSLDLTDSGFDCTLLHDFRHRLLAHAAGQRFLDAFLATCQARGGIKARGTQRTDSTHVLAAIRTLHRLACVLEAMPDALNQLSDMAPAWVRQQVPPAWDMRDGLRSDQTRLPKDASTREALARQVGADGDRLLEWVRAADPALGVRELPALEVLRQIWLQHDDRCTAPGREVLRWRTGDEQPPAAVRIASPYDLEARDSRQRETHGVGDQVHLTETCDADDPDLITQVMTTPATTPDRVMGPAIQPDFANRDVLPSLHVLDSGYVEADLLVTAQTQHQIEVIGPPFGSYSRQRREG